MRSRNAILAALFVLSFALPIAAGLFVFALDTDDDVAALNDLRLLAAQGNARR